MWKHTLAALICLALAACSKPETNPAQNSPVPVTFVFAGTPTQLPAPTSTSAPSPTPTPTPDPAKLLADAAKARWIGDDLSAGQFYSAALPFLPATSDAAQKTRLELAKTLRDTGDHASAERHLRAVAAYPGAIGQDAKIILGRMAQVDGDPASAIPLYQEALAAGAALSPTLNVWLGDAHLALNQPISAVLPLSNAVAATTNVNMLVGWREKLALAHQMNGNTPAALAQYEAILAVAKIPEYRARILWQSAQTMQAAGSLAPAYARMREVMALHPQTPSAFAALNALVQAGQPVDELLRGQIDFYADAFPAAQQAFVRAINEPASQTPAKLNEIRWWAAQNYWAMGDPDGAVRNLNQIIAEGANTPRFVDALLKKGDYLAKSDVNAALAAYAAAQKAAPGTSASAQAAQKTARALEAANLPDRALPAYLNAQKQYPLADGADEMLLRAAFLQYRLGKFADVISTTQAIQSAYANGAYAGAAQLWRGKAQILAGDGAYTRTLTALAQSKPESYEGERAAELLLNPAAPPLSRTVALAATALSETCGETRGVYVCLPADEGKAEAEAWMRGWLGISDTVEVSAVGAAIRQDARFAQGNELWRMGFKAEAMAEFQNLLNTTRDPLALWQLALHWRGIGVFRLSISAADALVRLSPARSAANAPVFLGRMVYPAYYGNVIVNAAREFGVNPLLAFSLVRQESLFEPFAESGAAANGLFQVIPPTGKEIAGQLNWPPEYSVDDLQRPLVSARFGAYYMSRQLKFFGDWFTALAAYNAGPGAAARWSASAGDDPDVFAALIPIHETSTYVQHITTNYAAYTRLYGR